MYSILDAEPIDEVTVPETPVDTPCVTEATAPHTATADNIVDGNNQTSYPSNEAYTFQTNIEIIVCLHVISNDLILANFFSGLPEIRPVIRKRRKPLFQPPTKPKQTPCGNN